MNNLSKSTKIQAQKMLWEQTYPEYYTEAHDWSLNHPKQFHEHIGMSSLQVIGILKDIFLTQICKTTAQICYAKSSCAMPT